MQKQNKTKNQFAFSFSKRLKEKKSQSFDINVLNQHTGNFKVPLTQTTAGFCSSPGKSLATSLRLRAHTVLTKEILTLLFKKWSTT